MVILGNAGSGKSTLSKKLIAMEPAARLSLDDVAFDAGPERRQLQESINQVKRFIADNDSWIIEGCYADIIEAILADCDELIFLNPGVDVCIAHCRSRPWEPDKFSSKQEQDDYLANLLVWVRTYETRADEYGLHQHRALYESFDGKKRELNHPSEYSMV